MSGPVSPEVYSRQDNQSSHVFRVTPQERVDQVCKAPEFKKRQTQPRQRAFGCKDENRQGQVGLNLRFKVLVMELVYPGGAGDLRDIGDKWVYIFRDNKPVARARQARRGDEYTNTWSVEVEGKGTRICRDGIELDPGPPGKRYIYAFFLSPVELTPEALDSLTKGRTLATAAVQVCCDRWFQTVPLPDPLRWAADAHRTNYVPLVEKALATTVSKEDAARFFIASVLKEWIKDGDRLDVEDELRAGQPDLFIDQHIKKLKEPWERAEQAGAYLSCCVDSPEYRAVMQSCMAREPDLERALVATAAITRLLSYTSAGRALAQLMVSTPTFLPGRHIFVDPEKLPRDGFDLRKKRWSWLFLASIFTDLLPGMARYQRAKAGKLRNKVGALRDALAEREFLKWADNIGVKQIDKQTRVFEALPDAPASGKPNLVAGASKPRSTGVSFKKLVGGKIDQDLITEVEDATEKLDKRVRADYGPAVPLVRITLGTVVEIMNVCLATVQYRNAVPEEKTRALISVAGAWADLASHGLGVAGDVLERLHKKKAREALMARLRFSAQVGDSVAELKRLGLAARVFKGLGGAAAVVGSVVDMVDFGSEAYKAGGENDYGLCVGRSFQATGALLSAFSGGMVLAEALAGSAVFGPAGMIIGFIGAALVIAGALVASWFRQNPNEKFALRSFLGKESEGKKFEPPWIDGDLPCPGQPIEECKILVGLLAAYRVELIDTSTLHIAPGYLTPTSRFEVNVLREWHAAPTQRSRLDVYPVKDRIEMVSGTPLAKKSQIHRDSEGNVSTVVLCLDEQKSPKLHGSYKRVIAWVRLAVEKGQYHPGKDREDRDKWVQAGVVAGSLLSGLDARVSSLDEGCHVVDKKDGGKK
jgi:hypothetical protein